LRLKEIAMCVPDAWGGKLRAGLAGTRSEARKILKWCPGLQ